MESLEMSVFFARTGSDMSNYVPAYDLVTLFVVSLRGGSPRFCRGKDEVGAALLQHNLGRCACFPVLAGNDVSHSAPADNLVTWWEGRRGVGTTGVGAEERVGQGMGAVGRREGKERQGEGWRWRAGGRDWSGGEFGGGSGLAGPGGDRGGTFLTQTRHKLVAN